MPNISNRLAAVEAAFDLVAASDFAARTREFYKLIMSKQVCQADIFNVVPEWAAAVERDIVREAIRIRRHVDDGITPEIRGVFGLMATFVAIPPDVAVPDIIRNEVVNLYDYAAITPWERPESDKHLASWLEAAFAAAGLGPNYGEDLRVRFHIGGYDDLAANDPRETGDYPDDVDWWRYRFLVEPLVAALTQPPDMTVTESLRPSEDVMQYIV
jgi:hypothetical protein